LVFNATFDPAIIPYDENYENRQHHSPTFTAHLERLAGRLIESNGLQSGRILEVGCGKGDFLRLLCREAKAAGVGYDTSFEPGAEPHGEHLQFHARYVSAADVSQPFDAVICRHVVEHVSEIGAFLTEMAAIARAAGDPVVVLETPRFEWIVEHTCLWDVFYEHCNYFSMPTLAYLCRKVGFRVVRHRSAFGAQYQVLELRLARRRINLRPVGIPFGASLKSFGNQASTALRKLSGRIDSARGGKDWALWGAGAKGVALVNQLPGPGPKFVVDVNPAKQGGVLPGTKIPIVADSFPGIDHLGLILIANPNYASEICAVLSQRGYAGETLTL
jgi:cyclopropane fatty-acyl-phospholipid synthase-like methyltransferase